MVNLMSVIIVLLKNAPIELKFGMKHHEKNET